MVEGHLRSVPFPLAACLIFIESFWHVPLLFLVFVTVAYLSPHMRGRLGVSKLFRK